MEKGVVLYDTRARFLEKIKGDYVDTAMITHPRKGGSAWCIGCYQVVPYEQLELHLEARHGNHGVHVCFICKMSFATEDEKIDHEKTQFHVDVYKRKGKHFCNEGWELSTLAHECTSDGTRRKCVDMDYGMVERVFGNMAAIKEKSLALVDVLERFAVQLPVEGKEDDVKVDEKQTDPKIREIFEMQDFIVEKRMKTLILYSGTRFDNEGKRAMASGPLCEQHLRQATGYVVSCQLQEVWLRDENKECTMCKNYRKCVNRGCDTWKKTTSICVNTGQMNILQNGLPVQRRPGVIKVTDIKHFRGLVDFEDYAFDPAAMAFKLREDCKGNDIEVGQFKGKYAPPDITGTVGATGCEQGIQ